MNCIILNFKKSPDKIKKPDEWKYKLDAIDEIAAAFSIMFAKHPKVFTDCTFVPVPPSKVKGDPLYDYRLIQMLTKISPPLDVRELVYQVTSRASFHESNDRRPSPDELSSQYRIDTNQAQDLKANICIFDDVITTGTTFKAIQSVINVNFPQIQTIGIFIARRAIDTDDI